MFRRIASWYSTYKQKRKQRKLDLIRSWNEIAMECRDALEALGRIMDYSRYMDQQNIADWKSSVHELKERIRKTRRYRKLPPGNKLKIDQFKQTCATLNDICKKYNAIQGKKAL